jgi:predicted nucleic acid-binding protein
MNGVADSSPLHYLVQIKAEDVLRQRFVELITPPEVIAELTHPRAPDAVRSWAADLHRGFA